MSWEAEAALCTLDAPPAQAVVRRCAGRTTKLDWAEYDVQAHSRNVAVLTMDVVDGPPPWTVKARRCLMVGVPMSE